MTEKIRNYKLSLINLIISYTSAFFRFITISRRIGKLTGFFIGATGVLIGYALYNPSFQEDIKKYIPQSQQLFDKINQWIPAELVFLFSFYFFPFPFL